jgi:hypothetical protein
MPSTNADAYNRTTADLQPRDYSGVQRPRHEMQGAPYQDMTRPTPSGEILNAASQTAEVNKQLEQQRKHRKDYLNDVWTRPHEPPVQPNRPGTAEGEHAPQVTQAVQSPRMPSTAVSMPGNQYGMPAQTPQRPGQSMNAQAYRPQPMPQNNMVPSPMAQQHTPLRPDQMHRRPPSIGMPQGMNASNMGPGGMLPGVQQNPGHGYPPSHMWQGPPQPSPLSQQHNMQQYAQRPQQSPLPQQSPMHASPQLHHAQSSGSMHGTPVQQYQTMGAMGGSMPGGDPGYQAMGQNPYQPSPSPHQFMQHQSAAAQQLGTTTGSTTRRMVVILGDVTTQPRLVGTGSRRNNCICGDLSWMRESSFNPSIILWSMNLPFLSTPSFPLQLVLRRTLYTRLIPSCSSLRSLPHQQQ